MFLIINTVYKIQQRQKNQETLSTLSLNVVGICLRDAPFKTNVGLVNLHPF